MIALIRRALDANRLAAELAKSEARVEVLEAQIARRPAGPTFVEVAKPLDASKLIPEIIDRVVADLSPILSDEAVRILKDALRGAQSSERGRLRIDALAAEEASSRNVHLRFSVVANTEMIVYQGKWI